MRSINRLWALLLVFAMLFSPIYAAPNFPDIAGHWGENAINTAAELGFVEGYPNGNFGPNDIIARGQFITILARVAGLEVKELSEPAHWAQKYVVAAKNEGLLDPYYGESFDYLEAPISRLEIVHILGALIDRLAVPQDQPSIDFVDVYSLSAEDITAIDKVVRSGIMKGTGADTFSPDMNCDRAQLAQVFVRAYERKAAEPAPVEDKPKAEGSKKSRVVKDCIYKVGDVLDASQINGAALSVQYASNSIFVMPENYMATGSYSFCVVDASSGKVVASSVASIEPADDPFLLDIFLYEHIVDGRTYWEYRDTDDSAVILMELDPSNKKLVDAMPTEGTLEGFEQVACCIINCFREHNGKSPAQRESTYAYPFAKSYAQLMKDRNFFGHDIPGGMDFSQRISASGIPFSSIGENLAMGYNDPFSLTMGWAYSAGHRNNLLGDFQYIDVGAVITSKGVLAAQCLYSN